MRRAVAIALALCCAMAALAQQSVDAPRLVGNSPPTTPAPQPPVAHAVTDDVRHSRSYPEQPPVIPHAIEGYQITLHVNQCLTCHARQYIEGSGAPMISVTHYMDRDGQVLADVTPRRYFCNGCHVPQTDAKPLVANTFRDALQGR
ncbi:MAG TPA: nitrate reductase cytochrome c-type subunit [Acetobacteraceae bacterium]|jgi:cytochrome c-type protein NapB